MSTSTVNYFEDAAIPYSSVASLREAHAELLKAYRKGECEQVLAEVDAFIRQAKATGALLDGIDDRAISQSLIDYWVTVLYRAKRVPPDATLVEFDPLLAPTLDDDLCPYVGLNAFQEEHEETFFGRQALIEQSLQLLQTNRILFVLGPSGSGKSSLVLAGLLPILKHGGLPGSKDWRYVQRMVPGWNPLKNLLLKVNPEYSRNTEQLAAEIEKLKKDPSYLIDLLEETGQPTLLVIDQFEEAFTICSDDEVRTAFISSLTNLIEVPGSKHSVVLTMRSDFENQILKFPDLVRLTEPAQVRVRPLATGDLHDAIVRPAKRVGLKFADGIVEKLVRDILGEDAGLPLLQFTLLRLWKMREKNRITWTAYKKLGSARVALSIAADELYDEMIPEDQDAAKWIFLRLVRPAELSQEFTSNRVRRERLKKGGPAQDRVERVLDRLIEAGLVRVTKGDVPDNDQIEVAHEALVRNWPMLSAWLEDERVNLRQRLRLTSAAEQWKDHGGDPGSLLRGVVLKEAEEYQDRNELEDEFVNASREAADQAERAKEIARERERELEEAKLLAAEERATVAARYAGRIKRQLAAVIVLFMIAVATAVYAFKQTTRAQASEGRARNSEVLAKGKADEATQAWTRAQEQTIHAEDNLEKMKAAQAFATQQQVIAENKARIAAGLVIKIKAEEKKTAAIQAELIAIEREHNDKLEKEKQRLATANQYLREANAASKRQDYKEAIEKFGALRTVYQQAGDLRGEADTLKELGRAYAGMGNTAAARTSYDAAVAYYAQDLKDKEATFLMIDYQARQNLSDSVKNLFDIYREREQHAEMVSLLEREMRLQEKSMEYGFGTLDDFDYVYRNAVKVYSEQERYPELESLYKQVLQMREKAYGKDSFPTYKVHSELAGLYSQKLDRYAEAEGEYKKALEVVDRSRGADSYSPETLESLKNLASFYRKQGQAHFYQSVPYYERLVANQSRTKEAPLELARDLTDLADMYFATGKGPAKENYARAISLYRREGSDPKGLITALNGLAGLYREQARSAEAEPLFREVLSLFEKNPTRSLKEYDDAVSSLAKVYNEQRKYGEEETLLKHALEVRVKTSGVGSPTEYASLNELGDFYVKHEQWEEAEKYYKQSLDIVEKVFGQNSASSYVINSLNNLGVAYRNHRLFAQAETYFKRALENRQSATKGVDSVDLAENLMNLAEIYRLEMNYREAEPLLARLIVIQEKAFGPDSGSLANTLELYAKVLSETGRREQAIQIVERVKGIRLKNPDKRKTK